MCSICTNSIDSLSLIQLFDQNLPFVALYQFNRNLASYRIFDRLEPNSYLKIASTKLDPISKATLDLEVLPHSIHHHIALRMLILNDEAKILSHCYLHLAEELSNVTNYSYLSKKFEF